MNKNIFTFLTQNYILKLAVSKEDHKAIKEVRKKVLLPKYQHFATIDNEDHFLFNKDDKQSFIYLLQYKNTKEYVGVVRVFFLNNKTPLQELPMQKDGHVENIDPSLLIYPAIEISRLALVKELPTSHLFSALELRTILTLNLMVATRINMFLYKHTYTFSIMEPSLHILLKRQKVNFRKIGDTVNYYGMRAPYVIETQKLLHETEKVMGELTKHYLKHFCQSSDILWQFINNNPYLEHSDIQLDRICKLFQEYGDDVDIHMLLNKELHLDTTA